MGHLRRFILLSLLLLCQLGWSQTRECKYLLGIRYEPVAVMSEDLPKSVRAWIKSADQEVVAAYERFKKRNGYRSDSEAETAAVHMMEDPAFPILQNNRLNRRLTANILRARYANDIRAQHQEPVDIRDIPEIKGRGVFAKQKIKKGAFIGEYAGIIRVVDYVADLKNMYLMNTPFTYRNKPVIIDGLSTGNFARFMNHSSLPLGDPKGVNTVFKELIFEGRPIVIVFAARNIEPGEQILVNYGDDYWKQLGIDPLVF